MLNLFRAAFWISVVAFFLPGNPAADAVTRTASSAASTASSVAADETYQKVADVCLSNPDLCVAGMNAVDGAQDLAVQGLDALASAIAEEKQSVR